MPEIIILKRMPNEKAMFCDSRHLTVALRIFHGNTRKEKSDGQDDSSSQVDRAPN
jgi:hypothetical protein